MACHVNLLDRFALVRLAQIAQHQIARGAQRAVRGVQGQIAAVGEVARAHWILTRKCGFDGAGARVPNLACVVGGARHQVNCLPVDVNAPDGTVAAVVGAEAFAVDGEPGVDGLVLARREEQIAFPIVLDLRDRTLVALQ